jgi:hypothetical protein
MSKKDIWLLVGFLLFILGGSALILSLVGVQLRMLTFIDGFGGLAGFVIRLLMIIGGIVIAVLSRQNFQEED